MSRRNRFAKWSGFSPSFSRKLDLHYSPENLLNSPVACLEWKLKAQSTHKTVCVTSSALQICRVWAAWSPWYCLRLRAREEIVEGALDESLELHLELGA